jgi:hypothetical protein
VSSALEQVTRAWPSLAAAVLLFSMLTAGGFINPVAHTSEVDEVKRTVEELKIANKEVRRDLELLMSAMARIEGKLDIRH